LLVLHQSADDHALFVEGGLGVVELLGLGLYFACSFIFDGQLSPTHLLLNDDPNLFILVAVVLLLRLFLQLLTLASLLFLLFSSLLPLHLGLDLVLDYSDLLFLGSDLDLLLLAVYLVDDLVDFVSASDIFQFFEAGREGDARVLWLLGLGREGVTRHS
jgi:hypothetical protein